MCQQPLLTPSGPSPAPLAPPHPLKNKKRKRKHLFDVHDMSVITYPPPRSVPLQHPTIMSSVDLCNFFIVSHTGVHIMGRTGPRGCARWCPCPRRRQAAVFLRTCNPRPRHPQDRALRRRTMRTPNTDRARRRLQSVETGARGTRRCVMDLHYHLITGLGLTKNG